MSFSRTAQNSSANDKLNNLKHTLTIIISADIREHNLPS